MGDLFEGKVALVTGAGAARGPATARDFVGEGAAVVLTGPDQDAIHRAADQLPSQEAPSSRPKGSVRT